MHHAYPPKRSLARGELPTLTVDVRWRPPINDSETLTLEDVAASLLRVYKLNPDLGYPLAEWKQILDFLNRRGAEADLVNPPAQGEPTIGYRRRDIRVGLPGGWRIKIPGSFSDFEPDDNSDFSAVDPQREIWFTVYRSNAAISSSAIKSARKDVKKDRPDYLVERDDYFAHATIRSKLRETGDEYYVVNSSNLAVGARAVCTIRFSRP